MMIGLCGAELVRPESVGASQGFLGEGLPRAMPAPPCFPRSTCSACSVGLFTPSVFQLCLPCALWLLLASLQYVLASCAAACACATGTKGGLWYQGVHRDVGRECAPQPPPLMRPHPTPPHPRAHTRTRKRDRAGWSHTHTHTSHPL